MKPLNADYNFENVYNDFRRKSPGTVYCQNIDFVEYGFVGDELRFAAILETTHIHTMKPHVFDMVFERIMEKTPQGKILMAMANALGCKAYIVGYNNPVDDFAVCEITGDREWIVMSTSEYQDFLRSFKKEL